MNASRNAAATTCSSGLKSNHRNTGTRSNRTSEIAFGIVHTRLLASATRPGYGLQADRAALCARVRGGPVARMTNLDGVRDAGAVAIALHDVDFVAAGAEVVDPDRVHVVFDCDVQ